MDVMVSRAARVDIVLLLQEECRSVENSEKILLEIEQISG